MRRVLILLGATSLLWAIVLIVFGGVSIPLGSLHISSRNPINPLIVTVLLWGVVLVRASRDDRRRARLGIVRLLPILPRIFVAIAIAVTLIISIVWGTYSASGADAYGYVSQAALWASRHVIVDQSFVRDYPWPFADWAFTPLGYRPGLDHASLVPTYAAGLPMVMALFRLIAGPSAVYWVPPIAAAVSVWLTSRIARRVGGVWAGALAAALLAASPTFAFQAIWPMSDIPAAMWWMIAISLAFAGESLPALTACGSGLATALALLTRPNLVLVGVPVAGVFVWSRSWKRLAAFLAGAAPGPIAIAILHTLWYGSPLKSGYGSLDELYAWGNAAPNLAHYSWTFAHYEQPIVAVAAIAMAAGLFRLKAEATKHADVWYKFVWTLAATVVAVLLSYLFYVPYKEWWYLRFFLPAYPAICCLVAVAATRPVQVLPPFRYVAATVVIIISTFVWGLILTRGAGTFVMKNLDRRYRDTGEFIVRSLPPNAIFLSVQESGTIRYYSGRLTVRFDWLQPDGLDQALRVLRQRGFHPYIALEQDEEEQFRTRFRDHSVYAGLDWPPAAMRRQVVRVRILDPADREKYVQGMPIPTLPIPPAR